MGQGGEREAGSHLTTRWEFNQSTRFDHRQLENFEFPSPKLENLVEKGTSQPIKRALYTLVLLSKMAADTSQWEAILVL